MSEAYKKFLASAPAAQREFRTIEVHHPSFVKVHRFVKDFEDQTLTLEQTAPRNYGEDVLFTALSMEIQEPRESQDGDQILQVSLGAIGTEVEDELQNISGEDYLTPIEVIYRKYYSGDLENPVLVLNLSASNFSFDGYTIVGFTGEDTDLTNKQSGELYTLSRFPQLKDV